MKATGITSGKTIYDLAEAFHISVSDARHIVQCAPGCFLAENHEIMLPPIFGRSELTAWITGARYGGDNLPDVVFEWLGHIVPPFDF
jgi:hypothetical protein